MEDFQQLAITALMLGIAAASYISDYEDGAGSVDCNNSRETQENE